MLNNAFITFRLARAGGIRYKLVWGTTDARFRTLRDFVPLGLDERPHTDNLC